MTTAEVESMSLIASSDDEAKACFASIHTASSFSQKRS